MRRLIGRAYYYHCIGPYLHIFPKWKAKYLAPEGTIEAPMKEHRSLGTKDYLERGTARVLGRIIDSSITLLQRFGA
jgi:hypothetical protein